MKCIKCNKKLNNDYDTLFGSYEDTCKDCKRKQKNKLIIIAVSLIGLGIMIGIIVSYINFYYELNKCSNLTSSISKYNFSNTIEMNAEYNSHCYYLNNYPFALGFDLISGAICGGLVSALIFGFGCIFFRLYREVKNGN